MIFLLVAHKQHYLSMYICIYVWQIEFPTELLEYISWSNKAISITLLPRFCDKRSWKFEL